LAHHQINRTITSLDSCPILLLDKSDARNYVYVFDENAISITPYTQYNLARWDSLSTMVHNLMQHVKKFVIVHSNYAVSIKDNPMFGKSLEEAAVKVDLES
jgi:hypothetical protein